MGWIEDSVEEFKKLPTAGKIAVGGAAVGVAILAYAQYRSSQASAASATTSNANGANTGSAGSSALTGLGIPSLSSSPADWQNWFSNGLTIPQTATDGAPSSVTTPSAPSTSNAAVSAPAASVATAAAHVVASVSAPPPPSAAPKPAPAPAPLASIPIAIAPYTPIQNPTAVQTAQHKGTQVYTPPTWIPTTIRPANTGHGRAI